MPESSQNIIPVLPTPVLHTPCAPPLSTTSQPLIARLSPNPYLQSTACGWLIQMNTSAGAECVASATGMPLIRMRTT